MELPASAMVIKTKPKKKHKKNNNKNSDGKLITYPSRIIFVFFFYYFFDSNWMMKTILTKIQAGNHKNDFLSSIKLWWCLYLTVLRFRFANLTRKRRRTRLQVDKTSCHIKKWYEMDVNVFFISFVLLYLCCKFSAM